MLEDGWQGKFSQTMIVSCCGAVSPAAEDDHAVGREGAMRGPSAPADLERAMGVFGDFLELMAGVLGVSAIELERCGCVRLAQRAGLRNEVSRVSVMDEYFGKLGRTFDDVRESPELQMRDPSAVVKEVERGALVRYEQQELAQQAGRDVAESFFRSPGAGATKRPAHRDAQPPSYFAEERIRNRDGKARRVDARRGGGVSPPVWDNGSGQMGHNGGGGGRGGNVSSFGTGGVPLGARGPQQRAGQHSGAPAPARQQQQPPRQGQQQPPQQRASSPAVGAGHRGQAPQGQGPRGQTPPPSAYTFAPGSLTCIISRDGQPNGALQAMESLARPGETPCAFAAIFGNCKKQDCFRCKSGHRFPQGAAERVRGAMVPSLLF